MFGRKPKFISVEQNEQRRLGGITSDPNHWTVRDIEKWSAKQFLDYFYDMFASKTGYTHPLNRQKHMGMVSRLRKHYNDNELFKKLIDTYFTLGYDMLSVEHFIMSTRQTELLNYINTGTVPIYIKQAPAIPQEERVVTPVVEQDRKANNRSIEDFLGGNK